MIFFLVIVISLVLVFISGGFFQLLPKTSKRSNESDSLRFGPEPPSFPRHSVPQDISWAQPESPSASLVEEDRIEDRRSATAPRGRRPGEPANLAPCGVRAPRESERAYSCIEA